MLNLGVVSGVGYELSGCIDMLIIGLCGLVLGSDIFRLANGVDVSVGELGGMLDGCNCRISRESFTSMTSPSESR